MNIINWEDGIGSRGRTKGLLIIPQGGQPYWFKGGSDDNVKVAGSHYTKNGKWSHTEYELEISEDVRALPVTQGWESGRWKEGFLSALNLDPLGKWDDIAGTLGVPKETLIGPKPDGEAGKVYIIIPDGPPPGPASEVD